MKPITDLDYLPTGGVRIVCTNLVVSNRAVIDTSPSTVSAIMQHLGSMTKPSGGSSASSSSRTNRTVAGATGFSEVDNVDGLVNFAPYGKKQEGLILFLQEVYCKLYEI